MGVNGVSPIADQSSSQQQLSSSDVYSQTLLNTLLGQQTRFSNSVRSDTGVNGSFLCVGQPSLGVNDVQSGSAQGGLQPSWSDPQVHIASATGKSASTYYDIYDFVPNAIEEEFLVGGQGE